MPHIYITIINADIVSGQMCPSDTKLMQTIADGILLVPFHKILPSIAELLEILLFGIAQRAP